MTAEIDLNLEPERYELYEEPRYQFDLDRRDFVKALGGGLLVCAVLAETGSAQQPGRARRPAGAADLGAWLHVGEDGQVTVFTGKVEVGQNIRTSLAQVVAEELRLPAPSIRMVMADTDRTPYDGGTAGSRTTPDMAPQLRRAAAAARELLLDLAAEQAKVERSSLVVADGKVTHPPSKRSFPFGQLTQGKKLTKTVSAEIMTTPPVQWKVAGTSVPKLQGRELVTGKHRYTSDVKLPGMLYGKVLRPETFNGTLVSVETKAAAGLPGVVVVRDGNLVGVAAPTEHRAELALAALRAEWKPAPQASGKELFGDLKKHANPAAGRGGFMRGSVEEGLKNADHRLTASFQVAYIAHAPLEPRAAVAEWKDGKLTVWTGTQRPFGVRDELARAFGLAADKVRVIVPDTGSGYGGKHSGEAALEAARLAKGAGKPVKLVWTREEEFTWAYFRPAGLLEVTAGVMKDGAMTAWDFHNYNSGASSLRTPYDVTTQLHTFHSTRSPLRQGSYRALASTANSFAREAAMDELAHLVGMDPLAFRLKNLKDARLRAVLEAAAGKFGWGQRKAEPNRGFGIAASLDKGSFVASGAEVAVDPERRTVQVVRIVTAFECGAVLNPNHLKNQIEGAVVMGLGGALYEAIEFDNGKILNPRFSRYRVPRFSDTPELETVLLDRKDLPSVGAGETPIIAVAPAVGNAIFQACGVRLRSLPMLPGGVLPAAGKMGG